VGGQVGGQHVVGVEEDDHVSGGGGEPAVDRLALPGVLGEEGRDAVAVTVDE
jgi:hypothetical protein